MSVAEEPVDATEGPELVRLAAQRIGRCVRDRWHLDEVLGVGGTAAVYAATHRNGKRVALKMLHPHLSMSPETRQRFLDEGADLDLFALRAMAHQPLHVLARVDPDPAGAWRRGEPDVVDRLARLELRSAGLRPPGRRTS